MGDIFGAHFWGTLLEHIFEAHFWDNFLGRIFGAQELRGSDGMDMTSCTINVRNYLGGVKIFFRADLMSHVSYNGQSCCIEDLYSVKQ